ncbi:MAG: monovalent cation/H(+) antiporter subunit G [Deltaproteobacteria bacterium]|nr:monovalent cation/H(+) antiporter subunit G [Deltaproteobacteria bacterium]
MRETIVAILLGAGTFFAVVAAIGVVRMPDLFMRLSATTKASTLGVTFILGGVALFFEDAVVTGKILAIIAFIVLTAPVAAHMLGRAAYFSGVPLWKESVRDDLGASGDGCEGCSLFPAPEEGPMERGADAGAGTEE